MGVLDSNDSAFHYVVSLSDFFAFRKIRKDMQLSQTEVVSELDFSLVIVAISCSI